MYTTNQILIVLYNYIQSRDNLEKIRIEQKEKYLGILFLLTLMVGFLYFQKKDIVLGLQLGLFLTLL